MTKTKIVADCLAERLANRGVRRFFGVPGGDCSLDLVAAAAEVGIDFVLGGRASPMR
jgi:acetolactate synthase I/II/III large subunit